jgi:3D (Asp-Asp-Asp) domain-containing protein
MIRYICQGNVALDTTTTNYPELMKNIQKTVGLIFLYITLCVSCVSTPAAGGQQKNQTQKINNPTRQIEVLARATKYHKTEKHSDPNTRAGKTSTLTPIKRVEKSGLYPIAADCEKFPPGTVVINKADPTKVGVVVDTGGAVRSRKAAKELASLRGLGEKSPEYNAPVFDFYSTTAVCGEWSEFIIVFYDGPRFKGGVPEEYLKAVFDEYVRPIRSTLVL